MMAIFFIISGIGISQLRYKMKGIYLLYCLFIVSLYSLNVSRYEGFYLVKALLLATTLIVFGFCYQRFARKVKKRQER